MKPYLVSSLTLFALALSLSAGAEPITREPVDVDQWLEPQQVPPREWDESRQRALTGMIAMMGTSSPKPFGFDAIPDIQTLSFLDPLPEAVVQAESLKSYARSTDPEALIKNQQRVMFPVVLAGRVRSSITIVKRGKAPQWQVASFGAPAEIRAIVRALQAARSTDEIGRRAQFRLVTVTGLNLRLLATRVAGGLKLVPVLNHPSGYRAGVPVSAEEFFEKLVPDARQHNGSPT